MAKQNKTKSENVVREFADMDEAAAAAKEDLVDIDPKVAKTMAKWWKVWYLHAGHKRLGRMLVALAKDDD